MIQISILSTYIYLFCLWCVATLPTTESTTTPRPAGIRRTVVVIFKATTIGQDMFIQGGVNKETVRPSCTSDVNAETSDCSISINVGNSIIKCGYKIIVNRLFQTVVHVDTIWQATSLGTGPHWAKYDAWREGDTKLDWFGVQPGQGIYETYVAYGTPLAWTTNAPGENGYQQLNT